MSKQPYCFCSVQGTEPAGNTGIRKKNIYIYIYAHTHTQVYPKQDVQAASHAKSDLEQDVLAERDLEQAERDILSPPPVSCASAIALSMVDLLHPNLFVAHEQVT